MKKMAKDKKVTEITDMEVDFGQWFTDVCKKAQLIDYSSVKGVFIYRPYGYAIWENIQHIMDKEFKKQGVENVYMPLLIPESLLQKEKDHVEGFAPECAWVTMGGGEKLEERYAIRPTSETLFCEHFANVLQTLTPREEMVLRLRFGLEDGRSRTLEEVGKAFDVTRERIRQIEAKALRKLRHPSRSKKLRDFLE